MITDVISHMNRNALDLLARYSVLYHPGVKGKKTKG